MEQFVLYLAMGMYLFSFKFYATTDIWPGRKTFDNFREVFYSSHTTAVLPVITVLVLGERCVHFIHLQSQQILWNFPEPRVCQKCTYIIAAINAGSQPFSKKLIKQKIQNTHHVTKRPEISKPSVLKCTDCYKALTLETPSKNVIYYINNILTVSLSCVIVVCIIQDEVTIKKDKKLRGVSIKEGCKNEREERETEKKKVKG